jgi:hypothetical protein
LARPTSQLGQTRTSVNGAPMSGFTSKADPIPPSPYVSEVPEPDMQKDTGARPLDHPSAGRMT